MGKAAAKPPGPPFIAVALVPLAEEPGPTARSIILRARWEEAAIVGDEATEDERKQLYRALLEIKWLPPKARSAIEQALGHPIRKQQQKSDNRERRSMRLLGDLDKAKKKMRDAGQRPKGGIHDAALRQVAAAEGMTVAALKKRFHRFREEQRSAREEFHKRIRRREGK